MGKLGMIGQNICFGLLAASGCILFLWFCWPLVFKGILNTGNVCGIGASICLVYYGLRHKAVNELAVRLWQMKLPRICMSIAAVLAVIGLILMAAATAAILRANSGNIPKNTPAVVLGCAVKGSRPSRVLQERIDAAYAYMQEHPDAVCVLSGGQGQGEDISEAECMYRELVAAGVDASRLYQEAASTNTQENLENSKAVLEGLGITGAVTVISSEFHLYRGRYWAQELGYGNFGYGARTDWRYLPTFFLREIVAVVHLWLF